jgi:hypothetical protein
VEKILDVSQRLFLEKGYDNTTIQDIVDHLDGLQKLQEAIRLNQFLAPAFRFSSR